MTPKTSTPIHMSESLIQAGFASPVHDAFESKLDLNDLLIQHPAATFFIRVTGNSMEDANIYDGDILVVDRALTATHGKIIIARLESNFTVKRFHQKEGSLQLLPANPAYPPIPITEESDFEVWGVVTFIIHKAH